MSSKTNNSNGNSDYNVTMFTEDSDKMAGMESSSFYQQPSKPSYPLPSYQQSTFSSYQASSMTASIDSQQPFPYQGGMQTSTTPQNQLMMSAATVPFQPDSQQQSTASFPVFNAITASTTAFPTAPASLPVNQLLTEVPVNFIMGANVNSDKLTMITSFSIESGMNNEWAKK